MQQAGVWRRESTCEGVGKGPLSRVLLEGTDLGVVRLQRPFDPGDMEREKRSEQVLKQKKSTTKIKKEEEKEKSMGRVKIACLYFLSCDFVSQDVTLEPYGGNATSPSRYGAGQCLTHWPSCRAGRPREQDGWASKSIELAVRTKAAPSDHRSAFERGHNSKR